MHKIKVLVLSPRTDFNTKIRDLLSLCKSETYEFFYSKVIETGSPEIDIVLLDEDSISGNPQTSLAQYSQRLSPTPLIYFCNTIDSAAEYKAVKSSASDYLYKDKLTGSLIHNCIKYVLESSRLRQKIRFEEHHYQSLFANAMDPIFYLNADWTIENVNQAFTEVFQSSLQLLEGKNFTELFADADDATHFKNSFLKSDKRTYAEKIRLKRDSGEGDFPVHLKIAVLQEPKFPEDENAQNISGFYGTFTDLSDQVDLQKYREASERLDTSYRLARILAHEIRNPLSTITLSLDQLADETNESKDAELYIRIIDKNVKRINELIDRLLHSSYRHAVKRAPCDLSDIVKTTIDAVKDRATLRNIKIVTDIEPGDMSYNCDAEKMKLALSNMLSNAIEAVDSDLGQVIVGIYSDAKYFHIYIEDNGIGMDKTQKESIFDSFFTQKSNGLGMGLPATQGIIMEHGGQIEVESELGIGSTFTILLPQSKVKVAKSE